MTNRRTSAYTIRFTTSTGSPITAAGLRQLEVPITDQGERSVSFRATDDEEARRITRLAAPPTVARILTTGLGIHRRTVTAT